MPHRYAVHAISRFIEHYGNGVRADDATAGWFAPLRDAVLAAESEVIPVVDDAEQAEALVTVALDLIDLALTGPGLDKPHRKAREAVRRYLERIGEVVVDRERVRDEIQTARDGLLGEVLEALGYQGGTRQQALDEIRRLRSMGLAGDMLAKIRDLLQLREGMTAEQVIRHLLVEYERERDNAARLRVEPPVRTDFAAEAAFAAENGLQSSEAPAGQDTPVQETWSGSRDVAGVAVANLADLPIGSVTAHPDGTYATVRQPYGWDLATDSEGTAFHVSSADCGYVPSGEVVLVGTGEIPEEWTWTYDGVAVLVRDWVARRKSLAATLLAQAEAASTRAEESPGNPVDVEPAPEPGQWIHDQTPSVDPDDDYPF